MNDNPIKANRESKIFFIVFFIVVILILAVVYYRYFYLKDFQTFTKAEEVPSVLNIIGIKQNVQPWPCGFSNIKLLITPDNSMSPLDDYLHFISFFISLFIGFLIFLRDRKNLLNQIFFFIMIIFSVWVFSDLILFTQGTGDYMMFFWSVLMFDLIIYAACLYFLYVFIDKKDTSLKVKLKIGALLLPLLLVPTKFSLLGFNFYNCEAVEGPLRYFSYLITMIYLSWIIGLTINRYKKADKNFKKQIIVIALGIILFLCILFIGNFYGSITLDWKIAQFYLLGIIVLTGFLTYAALRFNTFNIKVYSPFILVMVFCVLIFSLIFVRDMGIMKLVIIASLLFSLFFGGLLVYFIKKELSSKDLITKLNKELKNKNIDLQKIVKIKSRLISLSTELEPYLLPSFNENRQNLFNYLSTLNQDIQKQLKITNKDFVNIHLFDSEQGLNCYFPQKPSLSIFLSKQKPQIPKTEPIIKYLQRNFQPLIKKQLSPDQLRFLPFFNQNKISTIFPLFYQNQLFGIITVKEPQKPTFNQIQTINQYLINQTPKFYNQLMPFWTYLRVQRILWEQKGLH